jgi:hypothetical protein
LLTTKQSAPNRRIGTFGLAVGAACAFSLGIASTAPKARRKGYSPKDDDFFSLAKNTARRLSALPSNPMEIGRLCHPKQWSKIQVPTLYSGYAPHRLNLFCDLVKHPETSWRQFVMTAWISDGHGLEQMLVKIGRMRDLAVVLYC